MDRYEYVGMLAVGHIGASLQCDEAVAVAGEYNLGIGHLLVEKFGQFLCHEQIDGLLVCTLAERTGITPSMSRIEDNDKIVCRHDPAEGRQRHYQEEDEA